MTDEPNGSSVRKPSVGAMTGREGGETRSVRDAPPRLVYDDDCGFCTWCAALADRRGRFELVGFTEVTPDQRARLPDDWRRCAHLLTADAVYSCGEATEQTLARMNPVLGGVASALRRLPGYPRAREAAYRWAADRRDVWGAIVSRDSA